MRRLLVLYRGIFFALMCLVTFAPGARAQGSLLGRSEVALGGGVSVPLGDFGDVSNTGFMFTLRHGYYVHPQVAVGAEYAYFNNVLGVDVDAGVSIHQLTGHGKWLLTPTPVTPYLRAQTGLYHMRAHIDAGFGDRTVSENHFGLGAGAGVQLRDQGSTGGFVDAIYHVVFTEEEWTKLIGIQGGILIFFGTGS